MKGFELVVVKEQCESLLEEHYALEEGRYVELALDLIHKLAVVVQSCAPFLAAGDGVPHGFEFEGQSIEDMESVGVDFAAFIVVVQLAGEADFVGLL